MTRERQAKELTIKIIGSKNLNIDPVSDCEVYPLILAHDEEIRQECADRAVVWLKENACECWTEVDMINIRAAILGKEGEKE